MRVEVFNIRDTKHRVDIDIHICAGPPLGPLRRPGLPDRFFLGGATDVRGFAHRGIGPREKDDAMGGDCFYALAAHLYTPLPIKALRDAAGAVRCHLFANAGSCAAVHPAAASGTRTLTTPL